MPISKDRISSPLEAGQSILESQKLPVQLLNALDYVSGKLIRKHLHLTLIIVPNGIQLPGSPTSPSYSTSSSASSNTSMQNNISYNTRSSSSSPTPSQISSKSNSTTTSPSNSPSPSSTISSTCSSPGPGLPITHPPNPYNLTLLHASSLSPKATKHLHATVTKASKKFSLGCGWLSTPTCASPSFPTTTSSPSSKTSILNQKSSASTTIAPTTSITNHLIRRSLLQNDVLFSNEGLTLLSLDKLYTTKLALSTYSRILAQSTAATTSITHVYPSPSQQKQAEHSALAAAVTALRLLLVSNHHNGDNDITSNGQISKPYLLRSYDHLSVSNAALMAVNTAYVRRFLAPGGMDTVITGLADMSSSTSSTALQQPLYVWTQMQGMGGQLRGVESGSSPISAVGPLSGTVTGRIGPVTPVKSEDVTPVTRGEWGLLMARTAEGLMGGAGVSDFGGNVNVKGVVGIC